MSDNITKISAGRRVKLIFLCPQCQHKWEAIRILPGGVSVMCCPRCRAPDPVMLTGYSEAVGKTAGTARGPDPAPDPLTEVHWLAESIDESISDISASLAQAVRSLKRLADVLEQNANADD